MTIDARRQEYDDALPVWKLIDDMCDEKNLADHIPDLDVLKVAGENDRKNRAFKDRASFFGASRLTLQSLIGVAFEVDPSIELPPQLDYLRKNVDGGGADIWQQMQLATGQVLRKGRIGLFVAMPATGGNVSVADQEAGRVASTIHAIDARRIINWWTRKDGAETILGGVVFTDARETLEDYEIKRTETRRELAIDDNGRFYDRTWIKSDKDDKWIPEEAVYPVKGNGGAWSRIPFMFVGSEINSWDVQTPPMISLARKNRDHLRNSAINEEGIWFSGHIQPVADELDPVAMEGLVKAQGEGSFKIGGGQLLVAKGFRFEVAEPNTAARQGMLDKAEEMAALGARFVRPGEAAKTATQSAGDMKTQHSVLSLISVNVEDAYQWACERAAEYMRASGAVKIKLHRGFMDPEVTPEKMREIRENVLSGLAPLETMFIAMQRAGDIDPETSFEEFREEVQANGFGVTETEDADDA